MQVSNFLAIALSLTIQAAPANCEVYVSGTEGYHTFRIPAILMTDKGTLLAFCEGRKKSSADDGDIDLVLKRSVDEGRTWGALRIVHEEGCDAPIAIGNPCPVQDRDTGTIWLSFCRDNRRVFMTHSEDDGNSWAAPTEISQVVAGFSFPTQRLGTGPINGIQAKSGRLVMPVWLNDAPGKQYRSTVLYSDNHGATWKAGGIVPGENINANENAIAELPGGTLCMNARSHTKTYRRAVSLSRDGGLTWTEPRYADALVDPVCQGAMICLSVPGKDSSVMVFSNPASENKRERLTVRVSDDLGNTWPSGRTIHEGPAAYSCLTELPGQDIGCLYECGDKNPYERIVFARMSLVWLRGGE